jgi:phosphate transport system substrate-binding protein
LDAGQRVLDALAADPAGIAISNPHYASAKVRALAIGRSAEGPFVPLTRETVAARTYPLTRSVFFFAAKLDERLAEFLRYILSREGSQDVVRERCYLPLPVPLLRDQLARLR